MAQQTRNVNPSHYARLAYFCGLHCRICGKSPVVYHHLIPLCDGGKDDVRNIIALCPHCHKLVHGCRNRKGYIKDPTKCTGRRRKQVDGWEKIVDLWADCKIGTREAKERLGLSQKSHLTDIIWIREHLEKRGIKKVHNTLDISTAKIKRDKSNQVNGHFCLI